MPSALTPYLDLARDAGLALSEPAYAYGLLVGAVPVLCLAGLLVVVGLIATHGKSHGTRFSAVALFGFASLAGLGALLLRPELDRDAALGAVLPFAWLPPLVAAGALFTTMAKRPKARALGLTGTSAVALLATVFGAMLTVANTRATHPETMTWLDAPPIETVEQTADQTQRPSEVIEVLDTARNRR